MKYSNYIYVFGIAIGTVLVDMIYINGTPYRFFSLSLVVCIVSFLLRRRPQFALWLAAAIGLLLDIHTTYIGFYSVTFLSVVIVLFMLRQHVLRADSIRAIALLALLGSGTYTVLSIGTAFIRLGAVRTIAVLKNPGFLILEMLAMGIAALLLYALCVLITRYRKPYAR